MKTIVTRNKNGEIYGLMVSDTSGKFLTTAEVEKLKPYILHVLKGQEGLYESSLSFIEEAGHLVLSVASKSNELDLHYDIKNTLSNKLSEKVIVPQSMGNGLDIRHRPLSFVLNEETASIEMRFRELGSFNNFDAALEDLHSVYPSVVSAKEGKDATDDRLAASTKAMLSIGLNAPGGAVVPSEDKVLEKPSTSMALNNN